MEDNNKNQFVVKTQVFEGPLELLLELIQKRKLFINEISIKEVAEDYIKFLEQNKGKIGEVTSFIRVAATLILIKAKSLLPNLSISTEEESDIKDLEKRLLFFKTITDALPILLNHTKEVSLHPLKERKAEVSFFSPGDNLGREMLEESVREVLSKMPEKEILSRVEVSVAIKIEDVIESISDRIQESFKTSFKEFCSNETNGMNEKEAKVFTIVSFLALLEMVRSGLLDVNQDDKYSDMTIEKLEEQKEEVYE